MATGWTMIKYDLKIHISHVFFIIRYHYSHHSIHLDIWCIRGWKHLMCDLCIISLHMLSWLYVAVVISLSIEDFSLLFHVSFYCCHKSVGMFFETMLASSPGHVIKCYFFIAFKNMDWYGENMLHEGIGSIQISFCLGG